MKQSFFPWTTLSRYLEEIAKSSDKAPLQSLLLTLFGDGPAALYGPPSVFTFSSHLPSTVYRLLAALNPFRAAFDRQLYLTVLRSHPEAFSLLFADAQTLAAADTYVVGGSGVEMGKTKALINWMLEPRSSTLWLNTIDFVRIVRLSLQMLVTGQAGMDDLSGPVGIVSTITQVGTASETIAAAVENILYFGAMLAVNLAVMNMLPIPALDGGKIFFLIIDEIAMKLFRKKIPEKYEMAVNTVGFVALMGFMLVVTFNDVFKLFG